jgi:microcystin-dependent protein
MNNIVQTKRTPVAGRRPTGLMAGELYFNFADRTIGCVDENGTPIDIATAISVSALPPASPVPGLLWYRTAVPAGLYIWFVDADSAQWVQVAGGGSGGSGGGGGGGGGDTSVPVGPSPPADPIDGDLWFSTVEPVGLFIWVTDEDGAEWVPVGGAPAENMPIGAVSYFAGPTVPDGWLLCDNQAVSSLYPDLRDYLIAAGSPFGMSGADPRVPDLRGEFIRGWDDGRGVDAARVFGSAQLDQLQRLVGQLSSVQTVGTGLITSGILRQLASTASAIWQGATSVNRNTTMQLDTLFDPTVRSGDETRPRNVALLPCIKAFDAVSITGMADLAELLTAIATEAEARAGISNEKLMTPAMVQARSGAQFLALTGQTSATFDQVPNEANEIDLIINGLNYPANAAVRLDWSGAAAARAWSTRIRHDAGAYIPPGGDDNNTVFVLDTAATIQGLSGLVKMTRDQRGGTWAIGGSLRRSTTAMLVYSGVFNMLGEQTAFLRLSSTIAMTAGGATVRWRI